MTKLFPYLFFLSYWKHPEGLGHTSQSEKTCRRPDALPPSKAFLVGWKAVTDSTVLRFSSSKKECCGWPFSWNTCTLRGLIMLPTTKQFSCLGSHTADNLASQRPVCMLCLKMKIDKTGSGHTSKNTEKRQKNRKVGETRGYPMDFSKGDLVVIADVSYIL